jgi:predicted DNA-binding transcriptional regulator AlpA
VSVQKRRLTPDEIAKAFIGKAGDEHPVILSPAKLAALLSLSPKTIYEWIAKGHFDGAFRKRGKHIRFWRDRAIDLFFNGKNWSSSDGTQ